MPTTEEREYYILVKRVFDILAPFYDIVTMPLLRTRDKIVDFTGAPEGSKILDVATGTGKQALAFAKRGYQVTGIDLSASMLKVAKQNNVYENARFEVADTTKLRFGNNAFDVSCISFALHDMVPAIREKALKEMVRVTKPGGMIVTIDYALPSNGIGRFLVYNLVKLYEGKYYRSFIKENLKEQVEQAGIEIKSVLPLLCGVATAIKGVKQN